jgi:DNA mismatch endonuclease, patch repair protein
MLANRRRDTGPELSLRSLLHRSGLRFRCDYPVATPSRRIRIDIAFTRWRLAVFVDGCFWHCCPEHSSVPRANEAYWRPKLARNVNRDHEVDGALRAAGWLVLRFWEHTPAEEAAQIVVEQLATKQDAAGA